MIFIIVQELEILTNSIIRGDATGAAVKLFMNSEDKEDLIRYANLCTDKELEQKLRGYKNDSCTRSSKDSSAAIEESNSGFSLEEWATRFGVNLSI